MIEAYSAIAGKTSIAAAVVVTEVATDYISEHVIVANDKDSVRRSSFFYVAATGSESGVIEGSLGVSVSGIMSSIRYPMKFELPWFTSTMLRKVDATTEKSAEWCSQKQQPPPNQGMTFRGWAPVVSVCFFPGGEWVGLVCWRVVCSGVLILLLRGLVSRLICILIWSLMRTVFVPLVGMYVSVFLLLSLASASIRVCKHLLKHAQEGLYALCRDERLSAFCKIMFFHTCL